MNYRKFVASFLLISVPFLVHAMEPQDKRVPKRPAGDDREEFQKRHSDFLTMFSEWVRTHPQPPAPEKDADTLLLEAATSGNIVQALHALEKGARINGKDGRIRDKPLGRAVWRGHVELALILIGRGADIYARDDCNNTLLLDAVPDLHIEGYECEDEARLRIFTFLMMRYPNVNIQQVCGVTPLRNAAVYARTDVARLLLERGADPHMQDIVGNTPLHEAAVALEVDDPVHSEKPFPIENYIKFIRCLLERGVNVNIRNRGRLTALDIALYNENGEIARFLIQYGAIATPTQIKDAIKNPLCQAAALGDINQVRTLLSDSRPHQEKYFALAYAVGQLHTDVVIELLDAETEVSSMIAMVQDILLRTELFVVERDKYNALLKLLVEHQSSSHVQPATDESSEESDSEEITVKELLLNNELLEAAVSGTAEQVSALLSQGLRPEYEMDALWIAALREDVKIAQDIVQLLLQHGVDANPYYCTSGTLLDVLSALPQAEREKRKGIIQMITDAVQRRELMRVQIAQPIGVFPMGLQPPRPSSPRGNDLNLHGAS
jgi:ankyrin repeat protein